MKEEKAIHNQTDPVRRGQLLSTISTIGLIVLMIAYLLMTVFGGPNGDHIGTSL